MRHLFIQGIYEPMGKSGKTLREALLALKPEIYGTIAEEKIELKGLLYVLDRLPDGIEQCKYINLITDEGYSDGNYFECITGRKRKERRCYRVDEDQMNIEITRGYSEIYDILTHLTFLFLEAHKIRRSILMMSDEEYDDSRDW